MLDCDEGWVAWQAGTQASCTAYWRRRRRLHATNLSEGPAAFRCRGRMTVCPTPHGRNHPPQAVQDMCMHKMADKLYTRLQKVWGGLAG